MWNKNKQHANRLTIPNNVIQDENSTEVLSVWAQGSRSAIVMKALRAEKLSGNTEFDKLGYLIADIAKTAVNSLRTSQGSEKYAEFSNNQMLSKIIETCLDELCLDI